MLVTTNAIVLSKIKYGDSNIILSCYTESFGLKSYLVRGVLTTKKGKFKPAYLQPLSQVTLEASHKENRSLQSLRDVKPLIHYKSLHTNVFKGAMILFLSEVLSQLLKEEEENTLLYTFIATSLEWLDEQNSSSNFHLFFLLMITKYLGFYPDISKIGLNYFNLEAGKFESSKVNVYSISGDNLTVLKQLLGIKFDTLNNIKINSRQRQEFLSMILLYFELHLGGFKKPKSLQILNQVFS